MNKVTTLVLTAPIAEELTAAAHRPIETGGVLLVGMSQSGGQLRLTSRELHWVPTEQYAERRDDRMSIRSGGYVRALARAEETGAVAIWLHTHPRGRPTPSEHDDVVDGQLDEVFKARTGQDLYGSIVVSPSTNGFEFTGRVGLDGRVTSINRAWVVGPRFKLVTAFDAADKEHVPELYDRQVRAFGGDIQLVLRALRVAVVGSGGTGSAVVEQLARLGVGDLLLVDPDVVEETNLTRVYGSDPTTVGDPKAQVLARHVAMIAPSTAVESIVGRTTELSVAKALAGCDIIFGCTDDNAGRLIVSRLSSYYMIPVIDCGVLLSSTDGALIGIDGRVTVLAPGYPCLICRNRIDLARAAAEQLDPAERRLRQDEGYAPELGRVEPAVVSYTTLVASLAVAELLERLTGYGPTPAPSELIVRAHEREISTNSLSPRDGHFCDPAAGTIGTGDCEPLLHLTWRES
jgi:molybdopterin/thiamine biosynthesis adenylyltransferase/proteasome lid subunit RPN8/RPN11